MASTFSNAFKFAISQLTATMTETPDTVGLSPIARKIDSIAGKFGVTLSDAVGNGAAGGGDLTYATVLEIAGGGTASIDLRSFTDLAGRTARAFGRYKFLMFALLSTAQGGNACSKVTIGDAASNGHQLFFSAVADMTGEVKNGKFIIFGDTTSAGEVVDDTHKSVLITNNDGSVVAKLLVIVAGGDD